MDTRKMRRYLMVFIVVSLTNCLLAAANPVAALPLVWKSLAPFEDPRTGSLTKQGVEGAAANLIGDKIYVSHGNRNGDRAFLSIYDIPNNIWTHGGPTAPDAPIAPDGRAELAGGTAFGKHYAIGGRPDPLGLRLTNNIVEEFDPATNTWTTKASMPTPRAGVAAASWDNKIYVLGGRAGNTIGLPIMVYNLNEVYDPSTNTWTSLAPMPLAVYDHYATVAVKVKDKDKIYIFGGFTSAGIATDEVQIYDIATDTWSSGASMPTPRADAMVGVIQGQIAVFGGRTDTDPAGVNLRVTELYDPLMNTWSSGPDMLEPASEMAQGVTYDSRGIFAIGSGIGGRAGSAVQVLQVIPEPAPVRLLLVGATVMLLLCLRYSALSREKKISF